MLPDSPVQSRKRFESADFPSSKGIKDAVPDGMGQGQHDDDDWVDQLRQRLKKFMAQSLLGNYYDNALLILSVGSCFEYIYQTYLDPSVAADEELLYKLNIVELVFASLFGFDWLLNCFLAEHRILFFTSFFSMVDIFTVVPIFVTFGRDMPNVNYITNFSDAMLYTAFGMNTTRILRALRIRRKLAKIEDAVERFMGELVLSVIVMILFFASVMQFLEFTYQPHTYHTWMYYIWVTISTVGYGDISPISTQGRIAVMCIIGFSIISIPKMTNELIEKMALQSVYMRNAYTPKGKHSKHIVICGDISSISMNEFFAELFHEDHENVDLNAVLLMPTPPTTEMIFLLRDSSFFLNIMYLQGSALIDADLKRAKVHLAVAVFIMTDKFSEKPDEEDAKSILLNLSIKRYVASFKIPAKLFCLQLIKPSNRKHLGRDVFNSAEDKDLVVCLNEIKMGVLAKAAMCPGANTLLMNLISSFSDDEIPEDDDAKAEGDEEGDGVKKKWVTEYTQGCGWEIYTSRLSPKFMNKKFCEVSYELFKKIGLILFALQIVDNNGKQRLLLNPADYVIPDTTVHHVLAFVIAENKQSSDLTFPDSTADDKNWFSQIPVIRGLTHSDGDGDDPGGGSTGGARAGIHWFSSSAGAGLFGPRQSHENDLNDPRVELNGRMSADGNYAVANEEAGLDVPQVSHARPSQIDVMAMPSQAAMRAQSRNELLIHLKETHFQASYYLREEPILLKEATVKGSVLRAVPGIKNHILIIGKGFANIFDLIRPFRAKYIGVLRHIVLLCPDTIDHDVWSRVAMFDAISVVRGSPLEERNLRRAGIFQAKRVVVLADGSADNRAASMAALVDSDAIFTYQRVKKMNPKAQVVIEIINTSNVGYLYTPTLIDGAEPPRPAATDYKFSTQFAAGELFTTSLLDSIVCQGYYNPHIISVIDKLISGVDLMTRNDQIATLNESFQREQQEGGGSSLLRNASSKYSARETKASEESGPTGKPDSPIFSMQRTQSATEEAKNAVQGSCLYQIPLPSAMVGKVYGSLFKRLAKKGIIPLGLFRGNGSPHLVAPYVYTNPSYDTELNIYDRVFILSVKPVPDEQDVPDTIVEEEENPHPPHPLSRKNSLFNSRFSGSVSDGLNFQDYSTLSTSQQQLRTDLQHLSAEMNRKFDALLNIMQASSPAAPALTPAASASASVATESTSIDPWCAPVRGPVRLAPLSHTQTTALTPFKELRSEDSSDPHGYKLQDHRDSTPSDTTEILALRRNSSNGVAGGGSGGSGGNSALSSVFTFPKARGRSRGASIAVDPEYMLSDEEVAAAAHSSGVKNKPGSRGTKKAIYS